MRRPFQHYLALFAVQLSSVTLAQGHSPVVLGAGAYTIPVYPGSNAVEARAVPIVDVVLWNRLFLRSGDGAGVYLWHDRSWDVGVSIDADLLHRYEVDDHRLTGLGDVSKTARGNFLVTRRCASVELTLKLSTDIGGAGHGNAIDLQLVKSHAVTSRLSIRSGAAGTWNNTQYMQTFFGVDTTQSARSGLPLFEPDSGISAVRLFFSARYAVRPSWLLGGQLYASRSLGNAADSPITQRRTTPGAGVYVAYVLR